jgi:DNA polymerase
MTGDAEYVRAVVGCPIDAVTTGLRHAIIAAPGRALVAADFASIEARLLFWLAGASSALNEFKAGGDVYCAMATKIYGRPITKADKKERQVGKAAVLGLGYAMGWRKFKLRSMRHADDDTAQHVVNVYRKEFAPEVPKLWWALEEAAARAVWGRKPVEAYGVKYEVEDAWLTCRLPSGRKIFYYRPERQEIVTPWGDTRIGFSYTAHKMGDMRVIIPSGGHLAENLCQAMARDLIEPALQKAEAAGFMPVLQVYDELVTEISERRADPLALEQIMCDIPPWADGLPVAAEGWAGSRYRK